jgi:signal transduction histidine kinase
MSKISKTIKVTSSILYIIIIFVAFLKSGQISSIYNLPTIIIPTIFYISILYICYKYIVFLIKKDELEEELISIVNHTFRTPLTSMMWYTKELEKNLPQNERLLYLQNINNATSKVLGVIDILTGIKNIQNTSDYYFEAISIREIVEKSIKKYREEVGKKSIVFQVSTFKDIPLLTLDLKKISFVIESIIENSISYTKKDGRILIDCISDSKKLTLYISDTGIGLSWIDKLMIFSKFYRNSKAKLMNTDGMGLRLYLSKQIIKRHNGKIYAKSNGENEGTTFFIELPFRK